MNSKELPNIRFKNYQGKWDSFILGKNGSSFTGLSGKTKNDFGHGDAKYVPYLNVFSNSIIDNEFLEKIEIDNSQNKVKNGDIFFTTSSETPDEVAMSSVIVGNFENLYLNSFCFGYRLDYVEKYNLKFMAYLFRSKMFRRSAETLAQGISRYNISKNRVMEISLFVPKTKKEQDEIGNLLFNIDRLILLNEYKYNKLEKLRRSLLHKFFPKRKNDLPKIRFKKFSDKWSHKELGNSVILNRFKQISADELQKLNKGFGDVTLLPSSRNYDWKCPCDTTIKSLINDAEIITVGRARNANTKYSKGLFISSQNHIIESINKKIIDTKFLFLFIAEHEKEFYSAESTYPMFTKMDFNELDFVYPKIDEQNKISIFFNNIDKIIKLYEKKHAILNYIKRSLLDKMFC